MIFVHEGSGVVKTQYGQLPFSYGDYIVLPRGTIYQIEFKDEHNRLFIVESFSPLRFPKRYMSHYGQLMEHSPYCERDIRTPQDLQSVKGSVKLAIWPLATQTSGFIKIPESIPTL